jgi:hypothetical protein
VAVFTLTIVVEFYYVVVSLLRAALTVCPLKDQYCCRFANFQGR